MKIDWNTVGEIFIGTLGAGIILVALYGLFGSWLNEQGQKITG